MTPEIMQEALIDELKIIFKDIEFRDSDGKKTTMNFYKQTLARKESEEDGELYPWCIVKLGDNEVKDVGGLNQIQDVTLYFCVYYDKSDCQYQHTMLTLFEKVKKRFLTKPLFGGFFSVRPKMTSVMDDNEEETYPYFFGGMALEIMIPSYEREDDFI